MALFNVRVYGVLWNHQNQILLSDEFENNTFFTKLPGGGLEMGEGTLEGLKREFWEECQMKIEIERHIYTTDFYARSIFNDSQVISIYYQVKNLDEIKIRTKSKPFDFEGVGDTLQAFRWVSINDLNPDIMTFPTEKRLVEILKSEQASKLYSLK